jgi:hypothetical protein
MIGMKFLWRQSVDSNLIQLDGRSEASEEISSVVRGQYLCRRLNVLSAF